MSRVAQTPAGAIVRTAIFSVAFWGSLVLNENGDPKQQGLNSYEYAITRGHAKLAKQMYHWRAEYSKNNK